MALCFCINFILSSVWQEDNRISFFPCIYASRKEQKKILTLLLTESGFYAVAPPYWSEGHQILAQLLFYIDDGCPESRESKGCPQII